MKTSHIGSPSASGPRSLRRLPLALALAIALIALIPATALAAGSAATNPASKVHHTTAVLNGHLDPEGDPGVTECKFEWGETLAYGNTAPCAEGNAFNAPADVSATLSGLSPGTTYHFRLHIETTSNGPFNGADQSFRTGLVPTEHPLIASFGQDGTSGSSFSSGASPAMDQVARRLYVASRENQSGQLYAFGASAPPAFPPLSGFPRSTPGNTQSFVPIAVDNTALGSAGNVYFGTWENTLQRIRLHGVGSGGAVLPGFPIDPMVNPGSPVVVGTQPRVRGIAVNSAGEVWVTLEQGDKILKYSSAGVFLGSLNPSALPGGGGSLAFDSDDNLYVSSNPNGSGAGSILKLTAVSGYTSATKLPTLSSSITGLAFDPSTEYLYASTFSSIVAVYDGPSGELFDEIEGGESAASP